MAPRTKSTTRANAPLSSHPLFPAGIAVWFAALFGMGSMALRVQLLEDTVRAMHLDLVVPAAAPPLGYTARLLVAFLFALIGALCGYVLARLVARRLARPTRSGDKTSPPKPKKAPRPSASSAEPDEDLARLEAAREAEPPRRRRVVGGPAIEPGPDTFVSPLPVMDTAPAVLNLGELAMGDPLVRPANETPLELGTAAAPFAPPVDPSPARPFAAPAPFDAAPFDLADLPGSRVSTDFPSAESPDMAVPEAAAAPLAPPPSLLDLQGRRGAEPEAAPSFPAAEPMATEPAAPVSFAPPLSLLDRLGRQNAIEGASGPEAQADDTAAALAHEPAAATAGPAGEPVLEPDAQSEPAPGRRLVPRAGTAAQVLRHAPVDSLGMVELVERFALALAERRARDQQADGAHPAHALAAPLEAPGPFSAPAQALAAEPAQPAPIVRLKPDTPSRLEAGARLEPLAGAAPMDSAEPAASAAKVVRIEPAVAGPFADPNPAQAVSGRPFDMPSMMRSGMPGGTVEWFDDGDDEDHDAALDSLLPPRLSARVTPLAAQASSEFWAEDEDFDDEAELLPDDQAIAEPERFSSLLDMKPSLRTAATDPVEAPVRLPGGHPPTEPAVTEDALRSALAALQRMSGAA